MQKSPYQIIVRPVLTEKSQRLSNQAAAQQFTFEVARDANKREIKWAVEAAYGVKVEGVNTVTVKGKRRFNRASGRVGKRADVKKAVVTLADGQQIKLM